MKISKQGYLFYFPMQYLTEEEYKKIKERLDYLKKIKRPEIAQRIAAAQEYGDLAENAEYVSTKEEQGLIEAEIRRLENLLRIAVVVKPKKEEEKTISIGSKVLIEIDKEKMKITLVSSESSSPSEGKISIASPLGKSLLGKKKGEVGEIQTPAGKKRFKIIDIL